MISIVWGHSIIYGMTFNWCELQWYLLCGGTQLFMVCTFNWCELQWSLLCGNTQLWYAPLIDVNCNDIYTVWGTQLFMVCTFNWCELQWSLLCGGIQLFMVCTFNWCELQWYLLCGDTQLFMLCTFNWCELQWSLYCKGALIYLWYAPLIEVHTINNTVRHSALWKALLEMGVPTHFVKLILATCMTTSKPVLEQRRVTRTGSISARVLDKVVSCHLHSSTCTQNTLWDGSWKTGMEVSPLVVTS